jgi:hypothetical protein
MNETYRRVESKELLNSGNACEFSAQYMTTEKKIGGY